MGCYFLAGNDASYYTHVVCAALSILGSCFIIFCYLLITELKVYSFKLVFYLSVAQVLACVEFFFPTRTKEDYPDLCAILGFLSNSAQIIMVIWMACIAITLYKVILNNVVAYEKSEKYWMIIAWVVVPIIYTVPLFVNDYKSVGNSCTFGLDFEGNIMRLCFFFIPVWGMLLVTLYCYYSIYSMVRKLKVDLKYVQIITTLMYYPIISTVNILLYSLLRILEFFYDECVMGKISYVFGSFISLNGAFNALIFIYSPGIRGILMSIFTKNDDKDEISLSEHPSVLLLEN